MPDGPFAAISSARAIGASKLSFAVIPGFLVS
jgi:hypothetical protein